jgi:ribosomal protein L25 (general stress protein Ctc)
MADTPKLKVQKRTLIGKRVKTLRRNGQLPGVLYGAGIDGMPIARWYANRARRT